MKNSVSITIYLALVIMLIAAFSLSARAESKQIVESYGQVMNPETISDDELAPADEIVAWFEKWGESEVASKVFDEYVETVDKLTKQDYEKMDSIILQNTQ